MLESYLTAGKYHFYVTHCSAFIKAQCLENYLKPGIAKSPTKARITKIPLKSLLFQGITMRMLTVHHYLLSDKFMVLLN